jgi:hypothetical protein
MHASACEIESTWSFHRLQCNLLREQHVANGKTSFGCEALLLHRLSVGTELVNVHYSPVGDAVTPARVTADHVECTPSLPLLLLFRREPGP